jgi:putative sigma-54 modulation protein
MHVETQTREFSLTTGLHAFLRRRIEYALGRYKDAIRRVTVRLRDLNGPRGGADKQCQLQVELSGQPPLVISDTDPDLYVAIGRAAKRADRQVARRLGRKPKRLSLVGA